MRVSFFVGECHDFLLCPEEGGGGGGGTLFYGLYGEAPPESLGEGGGLATNICTGRQRPEVPLTRRENVLRFVIDSYFTTVHFQQLKGIQSSKQGM